MVILTKFHMNWQKIVDLYYFQFLRVSNLFLTQTLLIIKNRLQINLKHVEMTGMDIEIKIKISALKQI